MRQIADVEAIEWPDSSFLLRRTHTPDPERALGHQRVNDRINNQGDTTLLAV